MNKRLITEKKEYTIAFSRLTPAMKREVLEMIEFFLESSDHPSLRNHSLRGQKETVRSLTVRDDLRILLQTRIDGSVFLLDVGDHTHVYGDL